MRSLDERMAAVRQRTKELEQERKMRKSRITGLSAITISLVLIVGAGLAMPGVAAQMHAAEPLTVSGMASIFSDSNAMGYIMIALLAFILGVCVTLLCVYLQRTTKEVIPREAEEDPND